MAPRIHSSFPQPNPVQTLEGGAQRKKESSRRPHVRIIRVSTRLLDKDNLYGSVKPLLDQLCASGLIPGDREDQIELDVTQQKVKHRTETGTQIEITYDN